MSSCLPEDLLSVKANEKLSESLDVSINHLVLIDADVSQTLSLLHIYKQQEENMRTDIVWALTEFDTVKAVSYTHLEIHPN